MKAPLKWLRDYVDIALPPAEIARQLTMAGVGVESIQTIGGNWEGIVVGQLTDIAPHPNADRLRLATVDLGSEKQTVVCGAPNLNVGDKIAFARVGVQLIDGHNGEVSTLKPAKIRGVVSTGMVCSEKELGISDSHEGILTLAPDAPVGMPLTDYLGDVIFDLEVTPNRPDCLSIIGVAREIAAVNDQNVHLPPLDYPEAGPSIDQQISVEILDPDLCPRYCASLITGVKIAPSPKWMQERLLACGMRPINNVVDITNYVMMEYGQPLHSFDYDFIKGKRIIVRRARAGETMKTLNGADQSFSTDILVVADAERAVAVAGVMGGADTEVNEQTTSILLEAGSWYPPSIRATGRILCLPSEACYRFERGVSSAMTLPGLKRATQLILELAGGQAAKGIIDVYPGKREPKPVSISTGDVKRFLGVEFSLEQMEKTLNLLGFACEAKSATEIMATAPYWRSDISRTVDLVEEVARIIGYDQIPATMLSQELPGYDPSPVIGLKEEIRQSLVGLGFYEIANYSLTSMEMLRRLSPEGHEPRSLLKLANPMSAEQEYFRPNLRPNLLTAFSSNRRHEEGGIRLFELGRVYHSRPDDLPAEPEMLCGVLGGLREDAWWRGGKETLDFFDAKGIVEGLLGQLGVTAAFAESKDESLLPVKQSTILVDGQKVGVVGELHPKVLGTFDIAEAVYLVEIDIASLSPHAIAQRIFQPVPRFPAITRDIALVVDAGVSHRQIVDIVSALPLVKGVAIFDAYSGEQVPVGKKSLAYRITFQSPSQTLTDEEVNQVQRQILDRLSRELGATLRE